MKMEEAAKIKYLHDKIKEVENHGAAIEHARLQLADLVPDNDISTLQDLTLTARTLQTDFLNQLKTELASYRVYRA
jgi:hypothetical protein